MEEKELLLAKAKAKTLAHHFKKAAAHHEAKAAAHLKAHEAHKAHADHHQAMADDADGDENKMHKAHHKASASFHKSKAAHHEKLHKAHLSYAEHHKAMAAAHSEAEDHEKVFKLAGMEEEPLSTRPVTPTTPEPVAKATSVTPTPPVAAPPTEAPVTATPTPEGINETIQKALDSKLTEAVSAAFERVLSSGEFNQKVDQAIAGKLLEKLGTSTVETGIRTFPVPRAGEQNKGNGTQAPVDMSALDPELADMCKMD